ncbi:CvpA family protein [Cocleimonas flava]|jgi:membrane protein required for colicin V production|uniref:Membrane protein required for colicin V production n=1 Tax=Cocleimonas flava TaxID=634765 RepID=A0A4R1EWF1_9GAMM|nr:MULTISPECIES: CvpA family protein [Cocleimonas]MEB8433469.1 CvpA family protein [Cocleimonas sp. KMM 6892]MEC4716280.1 CvpA family protein [Cocleimonas sp. KMM 6895]MEC4745827.1 CvpA family protein [Cocleimonas sp. KMM 6896]TCJ85110.1 membrane protein required for colicin V production [Cocleimonas flava]
MDLNYFDIAIVVIILITALIGFMRGIVWMGIFLATWAAAILLAIKYKDAVAAALPIKLSSEIAQTGLAALLIFLGVLILGAIINFLFSKAVDAVGLGAFDRILGAGLGVALGALAITLLTMLLGLTELPNQKSWSESALIPKFQEASAWLQTLIPDNLNQYINDNNGGSGTTTLTPSDGSNSGDSAIDDTETPINTIVPSSN